MTISFFLTYSTFTQGSRIKPLDGKWGKLECKRHEQKWLLKDFMQRESLHNARLSQCTLGYSFWLLIKEKNRSINMQ